MQEQECDSGRLRHPSIGRVALLLTLSFNFGWPAAAETPGAIEHSSASKAPATSAGMINDCLRAQWPALSPWDVGGQFRMRYENQDHAGTFPSRDFIAKGQDNANDFLFTRVKAHLGYTPVDWFQVYAEGRDSRVFWDKRKPSPYYDRADLYQLNTTLGNPKEFPLTLKVGRQEFLYGDQRFVSPSDWNNVQRSFDAVKVRYESGGTWVDAFVSRVVLVDDKSFNEPNYHDWFSGVYASSRDVVPWQTTELYFWSRNVDPDSYNLMAQNAHASRPRDVYFIGTRWASLPTSLNGWDYTLEVQGQVGSVNNTGAKRLRQEAYGVFAKGGYTWQKAWGKPRVGLGYEGASGDSNPTDGVSQTFENLYGAPHWHYGIADVLGPRNVHVAKSSFGLKPVPDLSLTADYMLFWMADTHDYFYPESSAARTANGYGIHPDYHSFLGSELDLVAIYKYKTYAEFQTGIGHFFVGDYIRQSVNSVAANGGTVDSNWVYVQLKLMF